MELNETQRDANTDESVIELTFDELGQIAGGWSFGAIPPVHH